MTNNTGDTDIPTACRTKCFSRKNIAYPVFSMSHYYQSKGRTINQQTYDLIPAIPYTGDGLCAIHPYTNTAACATFLPNNHQFVMQGATTSSSFILRKKYDALYNGGNDYLQPGMSEPSEPDIFVTNKCALRKVACLNKIRKMK